MALVLSLAGIVPKIASLEERKKVCLPRSEESQIDVHEYWINWVKDKWCGLRLHEAANRVRALTGIGSNRTDQRPGDEFPEFKERSLEQYLGGVKVFLIDI